MPHDVFAVGMAHFVQCVGDLAENVLAQVVECLDADENERERDVMLALTGRLLFQQFEMLGLLLHASSHHHCLKGLPAHRP